LETESDGRMVHVQIMGDEKLPEKNVASIRGWWTRKAGKYGGSGGKTA